MGSGFSYEALDSMGVNMERVFVFDETKMLYNDKPIHLFLHVDSLIPIFGQYDRVARDSSSETIRIYYWDEIELQAVAYDRECIEALKIFWAVCLPYFYDKEQYDKQCRDRLAAAPKMFF